MTGKNLIFNFYKKIYDLLIVALQRSTLCNLYIHSRSNSAIDSFILINYQHLRHGHFNHHYVEWRMKRVRKILEIYDVDFFRNKKILEIGGGLGDIGGFLAELGADVTSIEGRRVNRNFANLRFRNLANFKSIDCNCEEDFTHLGNFDLVINFGLLEVVRDAKSVIECCAKISNDILLETMVCDSSDPDKIVLVDMDKEGIDNPIYGVGARPSPAYIEKLFNDRGFTVDRYFDRDLNTAIHCYDWLPQDDGKVTDNFRRFWRFKKDSVK
ncbi:MAG: methyltransferase domain-containing protein [Rhodospirillales bacterium]